MGYFAQQALDLLDPDLTIEEQLQRGLSARVDRRAAEPGRRVSVFRRRHRQEDPRAVGRREDAARAWRACCSTRRTSWCSTSRPTISISRRRRCCSRRSTDFDGHDAVRVARPRVPARPEQPRARAGRRERHRRASRTSIRARTSSTSRAPATKRRACTRSRQSPVFSRAVGSRQSSVHSRQSAVLSSQFSLLSSRLPRQVAIPADRALTQTARAGRRSVVSKTRCSSRGRRKTRSRRISIG